MILTMIIFVVFALITQISVVQSQSPRDPFETALRLIVTQLQNNITTQTQNLVHTITVTNKFATQPLLQQQIFMQGLSNLQQSLIGSIGLTAIPYNLITWNCNATTFNNYNQIASNNQQLLIASQQLQTTLAGLSYCPQTSALQGQYAVLQKQLNVLQAEFGYLCPVSNVSAVNNAPVVPLNPNQTLINNLNNPRNNWIFGQTNPQNYYSTVNTLILGGAQQCPMNTPYVSSNNTCISCQFIYDVNLKGCSVCPSGSLFNYSIHQCAYSSGITALKNTFPGQTNFVGAQPQFDPNLTSCTSTLPFFNGSNCIACAPPNYFDFSNHLCLTCGPGFKFDPINSRCIPNSTVIPQSVVFNSNLGTGSQNYVGVAPVSNPAISNCHPGTPYFNGISCISCAVPFFFNFTANACQSCPQFYTFNPVNNSCAINPLMVYYTSSLNGVNNYIGVPPNVPPNNAKKVMGCPPTAPFSNGQICLPCALPHFYNYQTNHCELCLSGFVFDTVTKACAPQVSSNLSRNSNLANASNFKNQVPPYNPNILTCPPGSPYFNGFSCITCQSPAYFDFSTLSCTNCPAATTFSAANRQCTYISPSHVTNTSNPNIFYNGNYSTVIANAQSQTSLGIPTCPPSSPFYNSQTNICMKCPASSPIYNMKYNLCMNCGPNAFFDQANRICISTLKIAPSLTRQLMNTFSL